MTEMFRIETLSKLKVKEIIAFTSFKMSTVLRST